MNFDNMLVRELSSADAESIENLFLSVFTRDPWNDDWSDRDQLHSYMSDISGNHNSLSLGLFENEELVGISLGSVIHWFSGTEYYIREFCVSTDLQHKGYGSFFLKRFSCVLARNRLRQLFCQRIRIRQRISSIARTDFRYSKKAFSFTRISASGKKWKR